jgi:hypothetical protein
MKEPSIEPMDISTSTDPLTIRLRPEYLCDLRYSIRTLGERLAGGATAFDVF